MLPGLCLRRNRDSRRCGGVRRARATPGAPARRVWHRVVWISISKPAGKVGKLVPLHACLSDGSQIGSLQFVDVQIERLVIYACDMKKFAETAEAIAGTTKKLVKTGLVAEYLQSRTADEAAVSAIFFSGRAFPVWEEATLQIGGRSLWQIVADLANKDSGDLTAAYRRLGDLGAVADELLPARDGQGLSVTEVERAFRSIAAVRGPAAKSALVRDLLSRASPIEAKYIVKI